jgi:hypothetical protein
MLHASPSQQPKEMFLLSLSPQSAIVTCAAPTCCQQQQQQ